MGAPDRDLRGIARKVAAIELSRAFCRLEKQRFFFATLKAPNPLKSPVSDEKFQENPSESKAKIFA